jgi:UDP-N-acetyl-D-mannosaminuronic acid transferase (WecB/TagA/CpsF family)
MGYVSSDQSSEVNRKITFKIKSISASIVVGMGMPKKDK